MPCLICGELVKESLDALLCLSGPYFSCIQATGKMTRNRSQRKTFTTVLHKQSGHSWESTVLVYYCVHLLVEFHFWGGTYERKKMIQIKFLNFLFSGLGINNINVRVGKKRRRAVLLIYSPHTYAPCHCFKC